MERLRSHYRHEVQRGRERRTRADACARPGNAYVPNSLYRQRLAPYIDSFPRESICVVRFEDLVEGEVGWSQILRHLGLPLRPPPRVAYNVTEDKPQYTRPMLWLWERGLVSKAEARPLPSWLRRLGRSILTRSGHGHREQLERSLAPLPIGVTAPLWEDAAGLQGWLGLTQPLWGPPSAA